MAKITENEGERVFSVLILDARISKSEGERTLHLSAEDGDAPLRMEIKTASYDYETQARGQCALSYLTGELGINHEAEPHDLFPKRLPRWAWDKVASLASGPLTQRNHTRMAATPIQPGNGKFVYVITAIDSPIPLTKIGIANSPEKRLAQLSTSSPHALRLELARYADNAVSIERAAHIHFSDMRRNGEWFAICPEQAIQHIIAATWSPS